MDTVAERRPLGLAAMNWVSPASVIAGGGGTGPAIIYHELPMNQFACGLVSGTVYLRSRSARRFGRSDTVPAHYRFVIDLCLRCNPHSLPRC